MAGPPFKPELRRFDPLLFVGHVVYLVEFGGAIKVGCTVMPRERLRNLHAKAKKAGRSLGRFVVFHHLDDHRRAESNCIKALRRVASNQAGEREYFVGVTFEEARSVVAAVLPSTQQLEG